MEFLKSCKKLCIALAWAWACVYYIVYSIRFARVMTSTMTLWHITLKCENSHSKSLTLSAMLIELWQFRAGASPFSSLFYFFVRLPFCPCLNYLLLNYTIRIFNINESVWVGCLSDLLSAIAILLSNWSRFVIILFYYSIQYMHNICSLVELWGSVPRNYVATAGLFGWHF